MKDYAKVENKDFWLRHPTLGDPSFDTFEKTGDTVHKSQPPYEWGVNGSLFRDPKTGDWYYYCGIYPYGYVLNHVNPSKFVIYHSCDKGKSWEFLGDGFEKGFVYKNHEIASDIFPDVAMIYDEKADIYWLAYDWCANECTWENAHNKNDSVADSGSALAYASSPSGPFTRLDVPFFSNREQYGKLGMFSRGYASTVLKRKNDWIALILCDSNAHFSWGLASMTAATPYGPWSDPQILLSVDRDEYYPAPIEFHPCFVVEEKVYAPATSVARNRNYQGIFASNLEEAHLPESWHLEFDGNVWHSRNLSDEKHGIWGQTINGFVHQNVFNVMYPSKDERDFGTLSVASRPWNEPYSDGFAFSGHGGKSISPTLAAYKDFILDADIKFTGKIEIAFDYDGILGPDKHSSDACPSHEALSSYYAIVLSADDNSYKFIYSSLTFEEDIIFSGMIDASISNIRIENYGETAKIFINSQLVGEAKINLKTPHPLSIIAHEFSVVDCSKFEVDGNIYPYVLKYNAFDALMAAGQLQSDWKKSETLTFKSQNGFIGEGKVQGKWNFIGEKINIYSPKSPTLGVMEIWVDGYFHSTVNLYSEETAVSNIVFSFSNAKYGKHCVVVKPSQGKIALDMIEVFGGHV